MLEEGTIPRVLRARPPGCGEQRNGPDSARSTHELDALMLERLPVVRGRTRLPFATASARRSLGAPAQAAPTNGGGAA